MFEQGSMQLVSWWGNRPLIRFSTTCPARGKRPTVLLSTSQQRLDDPLYVAHSSELVVTIQRSLANGQKSGSLLTPSSYTVQCPIPSRAIGPKVGLEWGNSGALVLPACHT